MKIINKEIPQSKGNIGVINSIGNEISGLKSLEGIYVPKIQEIIEIIIIAKVTN